MGQVCGYARNSADYELENTHGFDESRINEFKAIFKSIDVNGDNTLDVKEAQQALAVRASTRDLMIMEINEVFHNRQQAERLVSDIDKAIPWNCSKKEQKHRWEASAALFLKTADTDGDSRVSFQEFVAAAAKAEVAKPSWLDLYHVGLKGSVSDLHENFRMVDKDGSGTIDASEATKQIVANYEKATERVQEHLQEQRKLKGQPALTQKELTEATSTIGVGNVEELVCVTVELFKSFDADGNGKVTFAEFLAASIQGKAPASQWGLSKSVEEIVNAATQEHEEHSIG